jgi:UDP-glucose 4-epimerase
MKKALVTGILGFIGSNLAEQLLLNDYHVTGIDNLSAGLVSNLDEYKGSNLDIYNRTCDITDYKFTKDICSGMDYVFHLAAMNRALRSVADPITSNKINIEGTLNMLMSARDAKAKKFIFASSSSVYGEPDAKELNRYPYGFPKLEEMQPKPLTPYAIGKVTGEYYCKIFTQLFGLPTVVLRYFSVYGKKQRADIEYAAVIPKFIEAIKNDKQPVIYGDGKQTRPFTYVKDVVAANILFAENDATGIFNVANPETCSLSHLVDCINKILDKKIEAKHDKPIAGEIKYTAVNIDKAKVWGFEPKYNLMQGLVELVLTNH